jgi:hypothetical protein
MQETAATKALSYGFKVTATDLIKKAKPPAMPVRIYEALPNPW